MSEIATPNSAPRTQWIEITRILLTLLIINFHIPSSDFGKQSNLGELINDFFLGAGPALITFFAVSGYFTRALSNHKIKSRLVLLTVSYFIYNTLCIMGLNDTLSFSRIYGVGAPDAFPADYPLWFVRDLIFLSIGVFAWRKSRIITAAILVLYYVCHLWPLTLLQYIPIPQLTSLIPFTFGMVASRYNLNQISIFLKKYGFIAILLHAAIMLLS